MPRVDPVDNLVSALDSDDRLRDYKTYALSPFPKHVTHFWTDTLRGLFEETSHVALTNAAPDAEAHLITDHGSTINRIDFTNNNNSNNNGNKKKINDRKINGNMNVVGSDVAVGGSVPPLRRLVVRRGMDVEQVWAQMETLGEARGAVWKAAAKVAKKALGDLEEVVEAMVGDGDDGDDDGDDSNDSKDSDSIVEWDGDGDDGDEEEDEEEKEEVSYNSDVDSNEKSAGSVSSDEGSNSEDDSDGTAQHSDDDDADDDNDNGDDDDDDDDDDGRPKGKDRFFSLDDLEQFVEEAEEADGKDAENDESLFFGAGSDDEDDDDDIPDMEDEESSDEVAMKRAKDKKRKDSKKKESKKGPKYDDFFDPPPSKSQRGDDADMDLDNQFAMQFDNESDDDEEEEGATFRSHRLGEGGESGNGDNDEDERKNRADEMASLAVEMKRRKGESASDHQRRVTAIRKRIAKFEAENVSEKSWKLKGEVTATDRPMDSLLGAHLDFEHATRIAPVITEETTKTLEDLIKQRIRDNLFDDVERRVEESKHIVHKDQVELDMDKSKAGLGEVYEDQYRREVLGVKSGATDKDKLREDCERQFSQLCVKLDSLTQFQYRPAPPKVDLSVTHSADAPAITLEESLPTAVSRAQTLAPEEITQQHSNADRKDDSRGDGYDGASRKVKVGAAPVAESELSHAERRARRQSKKDRMRKGKAAKEEELAIVEKFRPGLKEKRERDKAAKDIESGALRGVQKGVAIDSNTDYGKSAQVFGKLQAEANAGSLNREALSRRKRKRGGDQNGDDNGRKKGASLKL